MHQGWNGLRWLQLPMKWCDVRCCLYRAALQWTRHLGSLTNSLVLAAAVAFAVGLLCASSLDVSNTPAVLLRCVLALALCCAPWSLQPFAAARAHLARHKFGCAHLVLSSCPTSLAQIRLDKLLESLPAPSSVSWNFWGSPLNPEKPLKMLKSLSVTSAASRICWEPPELYRSPIEL